jgi:ketosteroid isomerase-like protein
LVGLNFNPNPNPNALTITHIWRKERAQIYNKSSSKMKTEIRIMSNEDFDQAVKQYNLAMNDFFKGDPQPINNLYSKSDEISLAQLSGPFAFGRSQVTETARRNATKYREGETTFQTLAKHETSDFAYIVQIERTNAKIAGSSKVSSLALRVTSIFRREDGVWKLLHRHVDSNVFSPE